MLCVFVSQSEHCVVDHTDLRAVSVCNNNFTSFLDQIDDGAGCDLDSCHLLRKGVAQGVSAQGNDASFRSARPTRLGRR